LDLIPCDGGLLDEAADVGETLLRTLNATHLASALSIQADLTAFVAYDIRLVAAAKAAGIESVWTSPSSSKRSGPRWPLRCMKVHRSALKHGISAQDVIQAAEWSLDRAPRRGRPSPPRAAPGLRHLSRVWWVRSCG